MTDNEKNMRSHYCKKTVDGQLRVLCPICDRDFADRRNIKEHMKSVHKVKKGKYIIYMIHN